MDTRSVLARYADLLTLTGEDKVSHGRSTGNFRRSRSQSRQIAFPMRSAVSPRWATSLSFVFRWTGSPDKPAPSLSSTSWPGVMSPFSFFLERIASLTLVRRECGASREEVLTRGEKPMPGVVVPPDDLHIALVDLCEHGEFVVASTQVAPERLHLPVSSAIDAHLLSDDWTDWEDAVVSVAVGVDFDTAGRICSSSCPWARRRIRPLPGI